MECTLGSAGGLAAGPIVDPHPGRFFLAQDRRLDRVTQGPRWLLRDHGPLVLRPQGTL